MDSIQLKEFLKGTPLEKKAKKFRFLTLYSDITQAKIKGEYISVFGESYNFILQDN
jgi:hypothetical protein